MKKYIDFINEYQLGEYKLNEQFTNITTLKIGGPIGLLFYPSTEENFISFYRFYLQKKDVSLVVIGNGSNVLASSKTYYGIVVCFKKIKFKYSYYQFQNTYHIFCNAGVMLMDLINYFKKQNIGGLEKLSYIPGTIGGMVKMNAGAYNDTIAKHIKTITIINSNGEIEVISSDKFKYRDSQIKDIILNVEIILEYKDKEIIEQAITKIKLNRSSKQPILEKNAGSTFKNIDNISVWKLIDNLGLRGYTINEAMVSNIHTNFLINKDKCTSEDMVRLINFIKEKVYAKYKIALECEWVFINIEENTF